MKKEKALVILSGGQDSTTCLYWALKKFEYVEAITFRYGQNHEVEWESAYNICKKEGVKQTIIDLPFFRQLSESALLNPSLDINNMKDGLPASFVPNRNQIFITIAHAHAQKIKAENLVLGVCQTDYSGYPDCRQIFIDMIEAATNRGSEAKIKIHTPLMNLTKAQTFELAAELGCLDEIIIHTHTCYSGNRFNIHAWGYGCGSCPACKLRAKGWKEYSEKYFKEKIGSIE